jgi:hypothetical protein
MTTTRRPTLLAASAATGLALLLALAGCTSPDPAAPDADDLSAPSASTPAGEDLDALASLGAQQLVAQLEATPTAERRTDLTASVRPDGVLLSSAEGEVTVPAPDGLHYLSVAPYVTGTHDCFFHSLTTCTGELGGQEVGVRIVDDESGEVYVDETLTLQDNGFTGFWLPSDVTATVTVTSADGTGTATVSTGPDDLTCLTSLRLA